jgi:heat shock protein HtpX
MNRDVLFMTFAGVMLGTIVIISELFLRSMYYSRFGGRSSSKGGEQIKIVIIVVAVLFAILAPLFARILYFAISRKREYLADASAARLTRYPEGLASALETISGAHIKPEKKVSKITAPMYIVNPLSGKRAAVSMFSTHPPITERVAILRDMSGGANYNEYQKAYSSVKGRSAAIIPPSGLKDTEDIAIRGSSEDHGRKKSKKKTMREVGDLMRTVNKYAFIACTCGLRIKVPPDYKKKTLSCPKCGTEHTVPLVEAAAIVTALEEAEKHRKK